MRRERPVPVGQRAHVPVGAGAQPPPAGAVPRGDPEAEAAPPHPQEPGLRRQLPGQAGVPARGPGAAEDGAPARGGAARRRERRHAEGAGGPGRAAGRPAAVRQGAGGRRGQPAGHGAAPQHRLRHHHRQEPVAAAARAGAVLGGAAAAAAIGGGRSLQCNHTCTCNHTDTHAGPTQHGCGLFHIMQKKNPEIQRFHLRC
ncbi:hypothetical protein OJAV_G00187640 [Oryzias javanicus]|uniref:Uncharacterized protein n=1 Tax=Oryzias javanicus TaxID=123683 RepID=A0A3S2LR51_ORYJA|nr:hypothetical protein OJAV_G00187640 [Oryzias javanicus]